MRAKVTKAFPGRPDHEAKTREIAVGEEIEGELAAVAVREQWAEEIKDQPASAPDNSVSKVPTRKPIRLKTPAERGFR
jgi:hypothetical protein